MRIFEYVFLIVMLDQGVKQLLLRVIDLPLWLVSDRIGLELVFNEGVAFSIPIRGFVSIVITSMIIIGIVFYYKKYIKSSLFSDVVFAMIIGGALGNLVDRLFYGSVIDYIKVFSYPTFNIADIAIVVGFLILVIFFDRIKV